ncbi:DUF2127 domain-containing protein [Aliivibrio finisterrensis]|uniref:DUF2127 domain-containing protein n=1 Tax=Aliivibrio finisterrensis TaxID=511998 RepID=A0A6N6RXE4_9GAMM|nr:DUF2127 domain-containing protein [Aliivibrio finisterrensis]KAB2826408.1 DUF2127 domain-containing protein [Aliivibrio finisterrensis]
MITVRKGLRAVAILEAIKGSVSLIVGLGLHALVGENLRQLAESIVSRCHLNPASELPSVFIHAAGNFTGTKITLLAIGALIYSAVRFVEAYGLWRELLWTKWFALISGAIYLPFEIYEIFFHTSILGIGIFLVNVFIVAYMAYSLFRVRSHEGNS